jgi:hypothetical protein
MEMVLCKSSYNEACAYLASIQRKCNFGNLKTCKVVSTGLTEIIFERATFIYDEERGYLLRKE